MMVWSMSAGVMLGVISLSQSIRSSAVCSASCSALGKLKVGRSCVAGGGGASGGRTGVYEVVMLMTLWSEMCEGTSDTMTSSIKTRSSVLSSRVGLFTTCVMLCFWVTFISCWNAWWSCDIRLWSCMGMMGVMCLPVNGWFREVEVSHQHYV